MPHSDLFKLCNMNATGDFQQCFMQIFIVILPWRFSDQIADCRVVSKGINPGICMRCWKELLWRTVRNACFNPLSPNSGFLVKFLSNLQTKVKGCHANILDYGIYLDNRKYIDASGKSKSSTSFSLILKSLRTKTNNKTQKSLHFLQRLVWSFELVQYTNVSKNSRSVKAGRDEGF